MPIFRTVGLILGAGMFTSSIMSATNPIPYSEHFRILIRKSIQNKPIIIKDDGLLEKSGSVWLKVFAGRELALESTVLKLNYLGEVKALSILIVSHCSGRYFLEFLIPKVGSLQATHIYDHFRIVGGSSSFPMITRKPFSFFHRSEMNINKYFFGFSVVWCKEYKVLTSRRIRLNLISIADRLLAVELRCHRNVTTAS